ncbi:hypothetical protein B0H13DRAFT_1910386 [Mycena leptocephala]|nr:hypothetical protein B0H13DRAFT_1910386 [Mycena leptocephala]
MLADSRGCPAVRWQRERAGGYPQSACGADGWDESVPVNIPGVLSPYASNPAASVAGVKYNIVGHIYSSTQALHFIVRYLLISASKKRIFDYNGRKHEGHAIRLRTTIRRGSLTGPSQSIEGVPEGYALYMVVRQRTGNDVFIDADSRHRASSRSERITYLHWSNSGGETIS